MRLAVSAKVAAAIILMLTIIATAFSLYSTRVLVDALEKGRHSYSVALEIKKVLAIATDIETGTRGYIITGNEASLEPYKKGIGEIEARLASLKWLEGEEPERIEMFKELERLVREKMDWSGNQIALVRAGNTAEARRTVSGLHGQRIMDDIRSLAASMEALEIALLEKESARAITWSRRLLYVILAAGSIAAIFVFVSIFAMRKDLKRQAEAEKASLEKEGRIRNILDNAVDAIIVIDDKVTIEIFNRAAERIFGYGADEVVGRNVKMLMPEPYRSEHDGYVGHYLETGQKKIIGIGREVQGLRNNGEVFPLALSVSETVIDGKRSFTGLIRDLTESKAMERRLFDTLTLQKAILDGSAYAIISTTTEGIMTHFNRAAEEMLWYKAEELVGKASPAVFHDGAEVARRASELTDELGEPIEPGFESFVARARMGLPEEREWTYVRKDGTRFPVLLSITALRDGSGRITGFLGIASDITEKKVAEEKLISARIEAEAANRAKSEFLANMSHEIRTPMNSIIGMADLLSETGLTDEQKEYVSIFQRAGESLLSLINDILDLSKVEAGRLELEEREFNLVELIERSFELLSLLGRDKGLETLYHIGRDVPPFLKGDPDRLRQIIFNIVGNAIKFTEKGEVVLYAALRDIDTEGKATIEFSVRDTGIGIEKEKREMIFESFTQMDASITRKYGGTGLGLTITRRLVELMGGSITVDSAPGGGSVFTFTTRFGVGERPTEERQPVISLEGMRVFVIDDNATNRLIMRELLGRWGAVVQEAASGVEGIEALRHAASSGAPFSILFLDRRMPGLDGFETAEAIRKDPLIGGMKIILITSDARREDMTRIRETGIMEYCVIKPVKRDDIRRAVTHVLGAPEEAAAARKEAVEEKEALSILIAEDAEDNRLLIRSYLKKTPHKVDFALDGSEAVEKFSGGAYDIVFMDMQMPVMDGYTATRKIRQWEAENSRTQTPVIALTAYALAGDRQRSVEAGCTDYLSKPVKKVTFMEALSRYGRRAGRKD